MTELVDSFSRALADLIDREEREFTKAFVDHVGRASLAGRTASGMDAIGRLQIARGAHKNLVKEVMESALRFSKTEGVSVAKLLRATRGPMTAFSERTADTVRFPGKERQDLHADIPVLMALNSLRPEFAKLFVDAVRDALKGRVGFARLLPLPFHRAAINAVKDNPWLLLGPVIGIAIGAAAAYFGLK